MVGGKHKLGLTAKQNRQDEIIQYLTNMTRFAPTREVNDT